MKIYSFVLCSSSLFIFLISLILGGCKESDNENDSIRYRLIGLSVYQDGVRTDSIIYKYDEDKLAKGDDYSHQFQIPLLMNYSYPDENSLAVSSLNTKVEYSYLGGKMTVMTYENLTDSIWMPQFEYTYQYEGGKLVEEIIYIGSLEGLRPDTKISYEYEGDKVLRSIRYVYNSGWNQSIKEEAVYEGGLITRIILYVFLDNSYTEYYHTDLQYNRSLLTSYCTYNSITNETLNSYLYIYDDHGNMVIQESPEQGTRIEYIYEEGKGNFQQLQQPGGGIGSGFVLPYPTK